MVMDKVVGITVAVVIALVFLGPVSGAVTDNTGTTNDTENVTVQTGEYVSLGGYDLVDGTVTVERYDETAESFESTTEGTDYELNQTDGSLQALSSGAFSDGETARVAYEYKASGGLTGTVAAFIPTMLGLLAFVAVARTVQQEM